MTNKLILKKAIKKAVENGLGKEYLDYTYLADIPFDIIFSHDFAKAFWGDGPPDLPAWKHHLQQIVLKKDPIKYLEGFI